MITVAGLTPSLDLTYLVADLQLGRIHRPEALVACAGGKSLNMARVAARLGGDVRVVVVLGGPTGGNVAHRLAADGVAFDVVHSPTETRTCVSIASGTSHELTEVYQYAPGMPAEVWQQVRAALEVELARRPGWLSISGAPPAGLPTSALPELVELAHRHSRRVAVDTHGPALGAAVDVEPTLVKVNRQEAADLLGADPSAADPTGLAHALRARTGGAVVITDGREGSVAVDAGGSTYRLPAPARLGGYPVGSGDAFLGGLVSALDADRPFPDALRTAAAAGAANALVPGPGVLDPTTVAEIAAVTAVPAVTDV